MAGGAGIWSCFVFDGAVQGSVDHERRIPPLVPLHLACNLWTDDLLAQEPERELSWVDTGGHEAPDGYLLAALQPDPRGPAGANEDLLHPGAGPDLTPKGTELVGEGQRHVVHAAFNQIVPRVLKHGAEQPGELRAALRRRGRVP